MQGDEAISLFSPVPSLPALDSVCPGLSVHMLRLVQLCPEVCASGFPVSLSASVTGVAKGLMWALVLSYRDVPCKLWVCGSTSAPAVCLLLGAACLQLLACLRSVLTEVTAGRRCRPSHSSVCRFMLPLDFWQNRFVCLIWGIAILLTLVLNSGL